MLELREERTGDIDAIRELHRRAFGRDGEARLVDALRESQEFIPQLSRVAFRAGALAAHILMTRVQIRGELNLIPALSLAPVAVDPPVQNQGIGSALVRNALETARAFGHQIVVVIGHEAYYPRFGFISARARGLRCPWPVPDEAFMALALQDGALEEVKGDVLYPPPFFSL
jgi:putative acetyltransferase